MKITENNVQTINQTYSFDEIGKVGGFFRVIVADEDKNNYPFVFMGVKRHHKIYFLDPRDGDFDLADKNVWIDCKFEKLPDDFSITISF